jgi:carbonic anhydrase
LNTVKKICTSNIVKEEKKNGLKVIGAMYHTHSGHVEFYKKINK